MTDLVKLDEEIRLKTDSLTAFVGAQKNAKYVIRNIQDKIVKITKAQNKRPTEDFLRELSELKRRRSKAEGTHGEYSMKVNVLKEEISELEKIKKYVEMVTTDPSKKSKVPLEYLKHVSDKIKRIDDLGAFEHLKTFEEYSLHDNYLHRSNEVKEILSNYNLKYVIIDNNPILKITFPYSDAMYGGRWTDIEYKLLESFLKELLRYDFVFKVDETEEETSVIINCD